MGATHLLQVGRALIPISESGGERFGCQIPLLVHMGMNSRRSSGEGSSEGKRAGEGEGDREGKREGEGSRKLGLGYCIDGIPISVRPRTLPPVPDVDSRPCKKNIDKL